MKRTKIFFAAFLCIIAASHPRAQSLDSLILIGINNSYKIESLLHKKESIRLKAEAMTVLPAPTAGLAFDEIPVNSVNLINGSLSNTLSLSQMFPLGGKLEAMSAAELKNLDIIEKEILSAKVSLAAEIKKLYYETRFAYTELDLLQKTKSQYERIHSGLEAGFQSGGASTADMLMIKANIALLEAQILNAQVCCTAGMLQLQNLIRLDKRPQIATVLLPLPTRELSYDSLLAVLERNPQVQTMDAMAVMTRAEITANEAERTPDLMVEGMFMRMPQGMLVSSSTQPDMITGNGKTEYMYSIGASISLPFLPWVSTGITRKSEALAAGIRGLEAERKDMLTKMSADVRGMLTNYESQLNIAVRYRDNILPKLKAAADAALAQYAANRMTLIQYLEYEKMYLMEQMKNLMAIKDIYLMSADIDKMTSTIFIQGI